jgi:S1-C subfamily serine protease
MDTLGIPVGEELRESLLEVVPPSEMMKGTSTIWVDKGIRIEKGIGYPDRVMGSGFFVEKEGYILTNYHVVASEVDPEYEGDSRLYIRLPGLADEKIPAKVVGWDRIFDLALLKVEVEPGFVFRAIGDISATPGQKVFVIGSPVDPFLENTITSGIISAVGRRRLLQMGDVLQVDAPVNPGNSGGPLINERGELVGVVFAGYQPFEGLNFAIPVHWVSKMLPRLFEGEEVKHPWLGAAMVEDGKQLEITYIVPGESAEKGGLESGDIVTAVNGRSFTSIKDLQSYILDLPEDALTRVEWARGEKKYVGLFSLSKRPYSPIELALQRDTKLNVLVPLFGLKVKEVGSFLWEKSYVVERVIKGSVADNASISPNDPLNLQGWRVDEENRLVMLQVFVKKKKAGFLESILQLIAYMEPDSFL